MKSKNKYHSFYAKTMALFIALIFLLSVPLVLVSNTILSKYEKANYIKEYDIVLNDMHRIFNTRCHYFYNTLEPLFQNTSDYDNLCTLCTADPEEALNPALSNALVNVFYDICMRDFNCIGILLHSNITDRLYLFDLQYKTIEPLYTESEYPSYEPYSLKFIDESVLVSLNSRLNNLTDHMYGLSGTIYNQSNTALSSLGQIIVLYSTEDLVSSISEQYLSEDAIFSITDLTGAVLYQSSEVGASAPLQTVVNSLTETVQTITVSGEETRLNDKNAYLSYIYNGRYDYLVSLTLPYSRVSLGYPRQMILLLILFICGFSIILFLLVTKMSNDKVTFIRDSMSKLGGSNLDYRIPTDDTNDEFSAIVEGFNLMCDKLQDNVEKSYVYVMQQQTAELYALQTSINPHFLYNTLEMIRVQIAQGRAQDASQMILLLSGIYRNQMRRDFFVSLSEELEQCEKLIELYMYRFGNFEYEFDIDDSFLPYALPKNTLHPLIENYFIHGINPNNEDNLITLTGKREEINGISYIRLTLSNNGLPISEEELTRLKEKLQSSIFQNKDSGGFALPNVHNRLRIVFGEPCGLYPDNSIHDSGFEISVLFQPMLPAEIARKLSLSL